MELRLFSCSLKVFKFSFEIYKTSAPLLKNKTGCNIFNLYTVGCLLCGTVSRLSVPEVSGSISRSSQY